MLEAQAGYCRWVEHWLYNLRQFLFQKYQFSETEFTRRTDILNFFRDFHSCFAPIGYFKVIINTWAILAFRAVVKKWYNSFVLISLPLSDRNFWKASLCWMTSSRLYFIGSKRPVEACIFQIKWDMARGKLTETWWVLRIRYARKTSVTVPVHCCTSYTTRISAALPLHLALKLYRRSFRGLYPANTRTSRSQLSRTSLCSVQLVTVTLQHFPPKKISF